MTFHELHAMTPALRFWLLLSLCLLGFGLLYAVVHDAGCGARRRAVQRRIAALRTPCALRTPADAADNVTDELAVEALREAMAQAQQALRRASRAKGAAPVRGSCASVTRPPTWRACWPPRAASACTQPNRS
jgi:hypothetical protein